MNYECPLLGAFPLTALQQGMLFHSVEAPQQGVYVQQFICDLREPLDTAVFKRSWEQLIERHSILRTSFAWENRETPLQTVHPMVDIPWEQRDWRGRPAVEQELEQEVFLEADRRRGFDLAKAPLFRLALFRLAEVRYVLIWTSHHALLDGRSRLILLEELFAIYQALSNGRAATLAPAVPFQLHVEWLQSQNFELSAPFWRDLLAGYDKPTLPNLGQAQERGAERPHAAARKSARLSAALSSSLRSLAAEHDFTLNTLLQGAWAILLSRYSGQRRVVFGATRAGRHSGPEKVAKAVGLLINTVPVAVDVDPDARLLQWLQNLRAMWISLRPHEHTPLGKILGWSGIPAGRSLFDSLVSFENYETNAYFRKQGEEWRRRTFHLRSQTNYPLVVNGAYDGEEVLLDIDFDACLYDHDFIARMVGHLQTILTGIAGDPSLPLSHVPLLTQAERQQMEVEWNDTRREYPRDKCVHQVFEEQAKRTPDSIAVLFEDRSFTYGELNARANQVARYLRKEGVGPESLVGICMERSIEMLVGMLGILKSGGAYVPLDPSYPQDRLGFMLQDCAVRVVLAHEQTVEVLRAATAKIVLLDSGWDIIDRESRENLQNTASAENLAYVIYTSGSTGIPKGVSVPHRGIVRLVKGTEYVKFGPDEVFLQFAPISFDAATFEIWGCLLNGARLVVFPPGLPSLADIGRGIRQHGVTVLWLTAGLFREMVDFEVSHLRGVRQLLVGGDVLSAAHVRKALGELSGCTLINGYGPTENTTFSCCYTMHDPSQVGPSVWIGRPIANTQAYVLDAHLQPVPIGVQGELFLGGDGLARGYLKRPELTAEKFIANPFSTDAAARLFRTGDLVRWMPGGQLDYLGRLDGQVKIRGFRVELGEIESVLREHPQLRDAIVLAQEGAPGEKHLVAYLVAKDRQAPGPDELRSYLKDKLPPYMVPSTFVLLDRLPLTPNGKVDRRALAAPEAARAELDKAHIAPRTPLEETVAGIWGEVLGREGIGVQDKFFELGGDSLRVMRVISRMREVLRIEIPIKVLLEAPTIAALAEHIEAGANACAPLAPPIRSVPRGTELPLSFAQQRLWFLDQLEPNSSIYNIPFAARLTGPLNIAILERSLNEIVRRHEALRTNFEMVAYNPVQRIAPGKSVTLPLVDLSNLAKSAQEPELQRILAEEAQRPFDLSRDLMLRPALIRLAEQEHALVIVIHHIAADGWSMGILFQEMASLYSAFSCGDESPLAELPIQYADYAVWQQTYFQAERVQQQMDYWRRQLTGAPHVLELPGDAPRPAVQTYRGARQSARLDQDLVQSLQKLSQQEGATLFMTLLASFKVLLMRHTGQEDIVVGSPIAGRDRLEIEKLIGFFVNTLALRTDLSGNPTFRELLGRVRETALGAYAHQDLPFEKLVQELHPERNLSHAPLFQVMFAMQNAPGSELQLSGLDTQVLNLHNATTKFDLTLAVVAEEQGLRASIQYNTDLFLAATITRMLGQWHRLLEGISQDPSRRILDLPLLTEAERHQLLVEWNATAAEYPRDRRIHDLFEEQVERTPGAVAVVFEGQELTYRELNQRANQLAHYLRQLGAGPEVLVAVSIDRSLDMPVALLGVLKAGAAYVPLDPAYPKDRLSFILRDSQAPLLLTKQQFVAGLPQSGAKLVCLDADWPAIQECSQSNPRFHLSTQNLAYVLYTSGSTGEPKGVAIEHRNTVAYIAWAQQSFKPDLACVLASTSICFDMSVVELYVPLSCGGKLIVVKDAVSLPPPPATTEITLVNMVPSALAYLLEVGTLPSSVRTINSGGEQLPQALAQKIFDKTRAERLFDLYGPTETTCNSTCALRTPGGPQIIGRPIHNTQIYILDAQQQPVPIGVTGEIYIGGAGVTRGYHNRPALTAERFLPDPFGSDAGARIYRTGDLGRYLPDGRIQFLGRRDHQVKIRGFRIELGEIESVLRQHEKLRDAVVLDTRDASGDKRLVAYVVPQSQQQTSPSELRRYLQDKLPAYMVPATFVLLDRMPLTPNGKVDRRALAAADVGRQQGEQVYVASRSAMEELLSEIWREVLGLAKVSVEDNFFDLGGHSLLAMRLIARMSAALNRELQPKLLFSHPTIAKLAEELSAGESAKEPRVQDCLAAPAQLQGDHLSENQPSPYLTIERRPLLSLFAAGRIPPVQAAALGYLADDWLTTANLSRREIIEQWYDNLPSIAAVMDMPLGRIAIVPVPRFGSELYNDPGDLVDRVLEASKFSARIGARVVSLTGLIPSATDYGRAIGAAQPIPDQVPTITTGHATTVSAVVLTIQKIARLVGRELCQENIGFLGLGSIGTATLGLMLRCLPHPAQLTLCDLYGSVNTARAQEIIHNSGFRGTVRLTESQPHVPAEFYESTLIVGATNVAEVLDVRQLRPGTIIVDDSGPHCFSVPEAIRRLETAQEILFTEAGVLRSPEPIALLRYLPPIREASLPAPALRRLLRHNPLQITGCVLSSLLTATCEEIKPTLGPVNSDEALDHYRRLIQLGFDAADLHCNEYVVPDELISKFRQQFGGGSNLVQSHARESGERE